jgi:hypothetical protein
MFSLAGRLRTSRSSASLAVATLVACVYLLWLVSYLKTHDPRDLIFIGRIFITKSQASDVIRPDPAYRYGEVGYDGQFVYFIALDPLRARYYMDTDAYRYTRILYPLVARTLALGRPPLVPYTLLAANLAAIFIGTFALAAWLRRSGVSAWYAATFGFYPGVLIVLDHDLTEVSSYALVAVAILVHDFGPRWRMLGSGLIFGLAALARETAVVFTVCYVLSDLLRTEGDPAAWPSALRSRWRPAALLAVLGLGPLVVYKLLLLIWLGGAGAGLSSFFEPLPFGGLLAFAGHFDIQQRLALISVVAPGMLAAAVGIFAILRGVRRPEIWALLANVVLFVVFLSRNSYIDFGASARVTIGVVLAAVFCVPAFDRVLGNRREWFLACTVLWLWVSPSWLLAPAVAYGFHLVEKLTALPLR